MNGLRRTARQTDSDLAGLQVVEVGVGVGVSAQFNFEFACDVCIGVALQLERNPAK